MNFQVLGRFEFFLNSRSYTPTAPKIRQLLALLAVHLNHHVSLGSIVAELWDDAPPRSATATTHTYIHHLRRTLARIATDEPIQDILVTTPQGYKFHGDPERIDVVRFNRLLDEGRSLLERGRTHEAAKALRDAVDMSFEPTLSNVKQGPLLRRFVAQLEEQRLLALELHVTAEMRLGRYFELVPELRSLVSAYPLNEWFHAQLIICLDKSGRRGDALTAYQELRHDLNTQLGLDPSSKLQRIHQEVLISNKS